MRYLIAAIVTVLFFHGSVVMAGGYLVRGSEPYLREGPGIKHDELRRLQRGEVLTLRGSENRWVEVRTTRGETGWVRRSAVRKAR